jgi:hypothetical protein
MSGNPLRECFIAISPQMCYGVGNGWMIFPDGPTRGSSSDKGDPQHLSLSSAARLIQIGGGDKLKNGFLAKKFNRTGGPCDRETGVRVR